MGHRRNTTNCNMWIMQCYSVLFNKENEFTYQNTHNKPAMMWVFVVGSYSIRVITDDRQDGQVIICGSGPTWGAIITETTKNTFTLITIWVATSFTI